MDSCSAAVGAVGCAITLTTVGTRSLTATYSGDANYVGSVSPGVSHTVTPATTTTTILSDSPDPSVAGQAVTVGFSVTSAGGTPTGNVTVSDGTVSCIGTVAIPNCSLTFTTAGARTLTATYAGDVELRGECLGGGGPWRQSGRNHGRHFEPHAGSLAAGRVGSRGVDGDPHCTRRWDPDG